MTTGNIPYNARFEQIDATFTTYMSELYGSLSGGSELYDALYTLVKENVNPNLERYPDDAMLLVSCFAELENYFENGSGSFDYDSADSENEETILFKSEILGLINEYIDPDLTSQADMSQLVSKLEEHLSTAQQHEEERQRIINNLYTLYTQEEDNA